MQESLLIIGPKKGARTTLLPIVTNVVGGCDIQYKVHAALVYGNDAVKNDGRRSDRYCLPKILQEYIRKRAALELNFSSDRFAIKDEEATIKSRERSDKRRKYALSAYQRTLRVSC